MSGKLYVALTLPEYEYLVMQAALAWAVIKAGTGKPDAQSAGEELAAALAKLLPAEKETRDRLGVGNVDRLMRRIMTGAQETWGSENLRVQIMEMPQPMAPASKGALPS